MDATVTILYKEGNRVHEESYGRDSVFVELREYDGNGHDLILETGVWVDGELVAGGVTVLDSAWYGGAIPDYTRNKYIRQAIKEYDSLLAAHPTLSKNNG